MLIEVSLLHDLEQAGRLDPRVKDHLARIDELLQQHVSPERESSASSFPQGYRESEAPAQERALICSCTPSALLQLQKDYAAVLLRREGMTFAKGSEMEAAFDLETGRESHLLCHGTEGYFVPRVLQASSPVFDVQSVIPGSWLGSCEALLDELIELAHVYELQFRSSQAHPILHSSAGIELTAECAQHLQCSPPNEAKRVWFILYTKARASVLTESPIVLIKQNT